MRINVFVAQASGMSRRQADTAIQAGRVRVNGELSSTGQQVNDNHRVTLDGRSIKLPVATMTILLNKPAGYVCSRNGQGSKTVYELLPGEFDKLKTVGRLDKDSSGLILLTNDGKLANELTHPKYEKEKVYQLKLDKELKNTDQELIKKGVMLGDGLSKFELTGQAKQWTAILKEGRNRQIRRTFHALGYEVTSLNRTNFGTYELNDLPVGQYKAV